MPANTQVSSDIDTLLRLPSKVAVQDYLGVDDNTAGVAANAAAILLKAPILDATFTGTTTIPSADITTADFNAGAAGNGGELSWNNQEKTLNLTTGSGAGADEVVLQLGQEVVLYAKNKSNVNMTNGQVVLVDGTSGQEPSIGLAQADTVANARRAIGVITQDIDNNASGFVTLIGKVRGLELDDNTFSLGEVVYLSSDVAGGITTVQPAISVEIGHVVSTSNGNNKQGVLEVQLNNEAAVHELEQVLQERITENYNDILFNRSQINGANERIDALYPVYPYTTSIAGGIGSIKNLREADVNSGYQLDTSLTSVTLGSNCTSLGAQTFQGCDSLVEFFYHNSTTGTIGDMCFQNCVKYGQLINAGGNGFTLGNNISAIGNSSYRGCIELKTVRLDEYDIGAVGRFAFAACTKLVDFSFPLQTGLTQNIFTVISESVLRDCTALTEIKIPNTVTEINAAAFRDCTALNSVNCYAQEAPTLIGANHFLNINTTVINVPINATGYGTVYAGLTVNPIL